MIKNSLLLCNQAAAVWWTGMETFTGSSSQMISEQKAHIEHVLHLHSHTFDGCIYLLLQSSTSKRKPLQWRHLYSPVNNALVHLLQSLRSLWCWCGSGQQSGPSPVHGTAGFTSVCQGAPPVSTSLNNDCRKENQCIFFIWEETKIHSWRSNWAKVYRWMMS